MLRAVRPLVRLAAAAPLRITPTLAVATPVLSRSSSSISSSSSSRLVAPLATPVPVASSSSSSRSFAGLAPVAAALSSQTFGALPAAPAVSSKNLAWGSLGFSFVPTEAYVKFMWRDGVWNTVPEVSRDANINIHVLSNALHYGQVLFEGLKAHAGRDGKVRSFASDFNSDRLNAGADRLYMPRVPRELFTFGVESAICFNVAYIPPYGQDGSLYVRPMLFGNGAQLGLGPAPEYTFCVVVVPVGPYYKSGLKAVDALVMDDYDRAAPRGVGAVKVAGNYASDVKPSKTAAAAGYPIALYVDAKEHKYIEEFSTSNFIGISGTGALVTPDSPSVLPSVTNKCLQVIAADSGLKVERRRVAVEELSTFKEVAAVGTAVVITPVKSITRGSTVYKFAAHSEMQKLYNAIRKVQLAESADKHNWNRVVV